LVKATIFYPRLKKYYLKGKSKQPFWHCPLQIAEINHYENTYKTIKIINERRDFGR